jgi:hypothetical protein
MKFLVKKKFKNFDLNFEKHLFFFTFLLVVGLFTVYYKGYGDDLDQTGLIKTYISIVEEGIYIPSRYYGHPFAEIFIGFFSYNFGAKIIVAVSYIFFIFSIFFFGKFFLVNKKKIILLILLCISNPVLFLDNTNPSDGPLSLFLFSFGLILAKKRFILSSVIFALCIASRPNYALFIYIFFIVFIFNKHNRLFILNSFLITSLISFLFFLPVIIQNKLNYLIFSNTGGPSLIFFELFPRFIYKVFLSFGCFSSFLLFFYFFYLKKNFKINDNLFFLLALVFFNLIIFFFIPTKTVIISMAVILTYIFFINFLANSKLLYFLLFFNFLFYFISINFFHINYKNQKNSCSQIHAINAEFSISITKGYFFLRDEFKNKVQTCSNSTNYINGKKMKLGF